MKMPSDDLKKNVLIAASICLFVYLFVARSLFLFLPAFALVLFLLWKKGGGKMNNWEEDDPADWWKKGKRWEEH